MRLVKSDIEVFVSSHGDNNPYSPGDHEHFAGSGLYCETVIKQKAPLLVANALEDDDWKNNPDVRLDMISYLGMPLVFPDGSASGTICMLDSKTNHYGKTYATLLENFRDVIQSQLELVYVNSALGEENRKLTDYMQEIKALRGIVPICAYCKNVRDDSGDWHKLETIVERQVGADFSHSICDQCLESRYPDADETAGANATG